MSDDGWRARIRACCQELAGLAVPPSLVHGDLHLANVAEAELQARLRAAYLPVWSSFEAPERLALAWELAVPLGALHQAISYRSLMASSSRRSTSTCPSRPPGGSGRCWPACRDRRHRPGVLRGTARPPPPSQTDGGCTTERRGEMELDGTGTALPELIACPEPGCGVPAGVVDRFALASTDGPAELVRTWCLGGHGFTQRVDALAAWPVAQDARPLGTG